MRTIDLLLKGVTNISATKANAAATSQKIIVNRMPRLSYRTPIKNLAIKSAKECALITIAKKFTSTPLSLICAAAIPFTDCNTAPVKKYNTATHKNMVSVLLARM